MLPASHRTHVQHDHLLVLAVRHALLRVPVHVIVGVVLHGAARVPSSTVVHVHGRNQRREVGTRVQRLRLLRSTWTTGQMRDDGAACANTEASAVAANMAAHTL